MGSNRYLLGIDVGTSSTKVVLLSEAGETIAVEQASYTPEITQPGWSEQKPQVWWDGLVQATSQMASSHREKLAEVVGVGLSGQMHGSVCVDESGQTLFPALLWNDQRTEKQCRQIESLCGGREPLLELTLNPALTGFTAPKLLWCRENSPSLFAKVHKVLLPKDYIRFRLCGEFATDVSDASGTLLFDVRKRTWHEEIIERLELPHSIVPKAFESSQVSGEISLQASKLLGIPKGTIVVAGAGDQPAAAVGLGVIEPGVVSVTIGTSGVVFASTQKPHPNQSGSLQSFCHAVEDQWCVFGCMLSAGASVDWSHKTLFGSDSEFSPLLDQALSEKTRSGVLFLPYLQGERCPYADPTARGSWLGLASNHDKLNLLRSAVEGVCFGLRDQIELFRKAGQSISQVRLAGGAAKSASWNQLQSDVYGVSASVPHCSEASAVGAALLAGVGSGVWDNLSGACESSVKLDSHYLPNSSLAEYYEKKYSLFQKAYAPLRAINEDLSHIK